MKRLSPNRKIQNQSAGIAAGYLLRHLKSEGVSIRQAADTLQLPLATLKLKNPTLGLKPYNDLFEWAALELGDEFLGIHMAEQGDLSEIGILGYLILNSATLLDSALAVERYFSLLQEASSVSFRIEGDICKYRYQAAVSSRQDREFTLASALFFFSRHLSEPCVPIETFLPHPAPSDDRLHRRVFGDNIHYNYAYSGFIIDASILSYRVNDADTHLLEVLKSHADRLLSANRESSDIVSHLRLLIATSLSGQAFSATEAAQAMNMDRKTLYRHLSQAGLRYKTVKADVLTGLAKLALSESAANITEIGMQLGYSEASAFVRAFKHTTGITPLQYRRLHGLGL